VRTAAARSGIGERPAGLAATGIEFADHRPYEAGDDLRHVDHHVYARTRQHVVRRYVSHAALDVTILVDASASMGFGSPRSKLEYAADVAAALLAVGISGGDRVTLGAFSGKRIMWQKPAAGQQRLAELFRWLDRLRAAGGTHFVDVATGSLPILRTRGLLCIVSDFFADGVSEACTVWRSLGQEIVAVQVVAEEDMLREVAGAGAVRLIDAETGEAVDAVLNDQGIQEYQERFARHCAELAQVVSRFEGRYMKTATTDDLAHFVLKTWRIRGLIA
jgi:uncharacterized protein (DUF58 family)